MTDLARLLTAFTVTQAANLLKERECYRRGLRDEFDRWEAGEPWVCDVMAVYVGPPSTRVEVGRT